MARAMRKHSIQARTKLTTGASPAAGDGGAADTVTARRRKAGDGISSPSRRRCRAGYLVLCLPRGGIGSRRCEKRCSPQALGVVVMHADTSEWSAPGGEKSTRSREKPHAWRCCVCSADVSTCLHTCAVSLAYAVLISINSPAERAGTAACQTSSSVAPNPGGGSADWGAHRAGARPRQSSSPASASPRPGAPSQP